MQDLGAVYMTPGRLSRRSELTPVPSHGSTFVYMIPPQNIMPARVTPVEFTPVVVPGREFHSGTKFHTVSCKREMTTRFGVKSVCRKTGTDSAWVMFVILNLTYILST